jgi:anaphase-promoting complex subunit 3
MVGAQQLEFVLDTSRRVLFVFACFETLMFRAIIDKHSDTCRRHLPDAASVLCLIGKLSFSYGQVQEATKYYAESIRLNPFMWDAFIGLCNTGSNLPSCFFKPKQLTVARCQRSDHQHFQGNA